MARPLVAVAAAAVLGLPAASLSATPVLRVTPRTVAPGGVVHVAGNADGCPRGDDVLVLSRAFAGPDFAGLGTVRAKVRAHGAFAAAGHVRRRARRGLYGVSARCGGGNLGVSKTIRVA